MGPQMFIKFVEGLISKGAGVVISLMVLVKAYEKFEHSYTVSGVDEHVYSEIIGLGLYNCLLEVLERLLAFLWL